MYEVGEERMFGVRRGRWGLCGDTRYLEGGEGKMRHVRRGETLREKRGKNSKRRGGGFLSFLERLRFNSLALSSML